MKRSISFMLALAAATSSTANAQAVVQSRGIDARVDYASLKELGPWDDRNYGLTADDLELLGPNERELTEGIPVFYRVALRREQPEMPRSGPAQYPKSALPRFLVEYGGYRVEGRLYRAYERRDGRYEILFSADQGVGEEAFLQQRALVGEVRVTDPNGAAESAIAINPVNADLVVAGSNGPGGGQRMHYSTDGGETWTQAAALPGGGTCCDPTVGWSANGMKAYAATLGSPTGNFRVIFYRSSDNGQTWDDLPGASAFRVLGTGSTDKEYLHVDVAATSPYQDNIYLTWHQGNTMYFSHSADLGDTWSAEQTVSSGSSERGIGSDITTDSTGNVYYLWPAFNSQKIWVRRSTDGGATFDPTVEVGSTLGSFDFPLPSMETRNVFIYVSADTDRAGGVFDGSVYAAWTDNTNADSGNPTDNHGRIQVAYSRDAGATWNVSTPHETADSTTVDRYHQWLAVGPDGTVYVVFYDTRRDPSRQSVDFFFSRSTDGAVTWTTPERMTTVQSPNINDGFEFGDYNGLDVIMGELIAIFTDNRDETGGTTQSVDVYAAGAVVESGGIFSDGFESGDTSAWSATVGN